jgi:putative oxidoreductase
MIPLVARLILAGVFISAGLLKVADPSLFASDIAHFHLLPYPAALAVSLYLPWLEIVAGVAVITGRFRAGALLILGILCVGFCAAIGSALVRGLDIECGCFGHGSAPLPLFASLARGAVLGAAAIMLYRRERKGVSHPIVQGYPPAH